MKNFRQAGKGSRKLFPGAGRTGGRYSGSLGGRLLARYFASLVVIALVVAALAAVCALILTRFDSWRNYIEWYRAVYFFRYNLPLVYAGVVLAGWVVCTVYFFHVPISYLDRLIDAAEELARDPERPISLPEPLREAQDHLNLAREQSVKAAAAAKEAEQRKNDLIVYLAHDLKTPLTSVVGYLSLLRDEPEISAPLREKYTGTALDKALRLEDLINEFFDITRFNLTTLSLEPERTNLSRMLEQLASEFLPILGEKDLTWETGIQPGVEILCDRDKFQRVLDNLIRNAVSYSYPGSAIHLAMSAEEETGEVVLMVKNHGRTIPPEKLSRIFQQFYRADSSRSTSTGGAGLGLAIAKEIVELHHGSITAESENETVAFTLRLPTGLS